MKRKRQNNKNKFSFTTRREKKHFSFFSPFMKSKMKKYFVLKIIKF